MFSADFWCSADVIVLDVLTEDELLYKMNKLRFRFLGQINGAVIEDALVLLCAGGSSSLDFLSSVDFSQLLFSSFSVVSRQSFFGYQLLINI